MKKKYFSLIRNRNRKGILFLIPWLIGVVLFFVMPILQTLDYGFNNIRIGDREVIKTFIGLQNYVDAFTKDTNFVRLLTSSITNLVTDVPVIIIFSFLVAVILNHKFRGSGVYKTIFFLSIMLSSGVFYRLQMQVGVLNVAQLGQAVSDNQGIAEFMDALRIEKYLSEIGVPESTVSFLITPMRRVFSIITKSGLQIFIFLSGLYGINPSLYEASNVEGATAWENFWKITFPMISPLILVNTIYSIVDSFMNTDNATLNYIYNRTFYDGRFGYGSALAWIYFLIVSVILLIVGVLISRKVFYYE